MVEVTQQQSTQRLNDREPEQDEKRTTPSSFAVSNKAVKETSAFSVCSPTDVCAFCIFFWLVPRYCLWTS